MDARAALLLGGSGDARAGGEERLGGDGGDAFDDDGRPCYCPGCWRCSPACDDGAARNGALPSSPRFSLDLVARVLRSDSPAAGEAELDQEVDEVVRLAAELLVVGGNVVVFMHCAVREMVTRRRRGPRERPRRWAEVDDELPRFTVGMRRSWARRWTRPYYLRRSCSSASTPSSSCVSPMGNCSPDFVASSGSYHSSSDVSS